MFIFSEQSSRDNSDEGVCPSIHLSVSLPASRRSCGIRTTCSPRAFSLPSALPSSSPVSPSVLFRARSCELARTIYISQRDICPHHNRVSLLSNVFGVFFSLSSLVLTSVRQVCFRWSLVPVTISAIMDRNEKCV